MAKKSSASESSAASKTTAAAKKTADTEIKESVFVEYGGSQVDIKTVIDNIKAAYSAEGSSEPVKTVDVYIKPEENAAYYVVNGNSDGKKVELF